MMLGSLGRVRSNETSQRVEHAAITKRGCRPAVESDGLRRLSFPTILQPSKRLPSIFRRTRLLPTPGAVVRAALREGALSGTRDGVVRGTPVWCIRGHRKVWWSKTVSIFPRTSPWHFRSMRRVHPCAIRVHQKRDHHRRVIGALTLRILRLNRLLNRAQVQLRDHLQNEPRQMVHQKPVAQRRGRGQIRLVLRPRLIAVAHEHPSASVPQDLCGMDTWRNSGTISSIKRSICSVRWQAFEPSVKSGMMISSTPAST